MTNLKKIALKGKFINITKNNKDNLECNGQINGGYLISKLFLSFFIKKLPQINELIVENMQMISPED